MTNEQKAALAAHDELYRAYDQVEGPLDVLLRTLERGHFQAAQDMIPDLEARLSRLRAEAMRLEEKYRKEPDVPDEVPADPKADSPAAPPAQPSVPAG